MAIEGEPSFDSLERVSLSRGELALERRGINDFLHETLTGKLGCTVAIQDAQTISISVSPVFKEQAGKGNQITVTKGQWVTSINRSDGRQHDDMPIDFKINVVNHEGNISSYSYVNTTRDEE